MPDSEHLTKEEFQQLPDSEKLNTLFEMNMQLISQTEPIIDAFSYVLLVKRFGVGIAGIIVAISTIGTALIWLWDFVKVHIK